MTETQITVRKTDLRIGELVREANKLMGSKFLVLVGLTALMLLVCSAVPVVLEGALMIGLMICFQHVRDGKEVGLETLFSGFDFFVEGFIARLVLLGVHLLCTLTMIPSCVLLFYGLSQQEEVIFSLAAISLGLLTVPITMFTLTHSVLTFSLMAQHKVKGVDAVKIAARGIFANPQSCIKLSAAAVGIIMLGALFCGVGMLITAPFGYIMIWLAAKELFEVETLAEESSPLPE